MSTPNDPNDPNDALIERLQRLGQQQPPPTNQAHHLSLIQAELGRADAGRSRSAISPTWRPSGIGRRLRLVAVFVAGFVLGGTGLAYAGALPGPMQNGAANVLSRVGLSVPRSTVGCPDGKEYKNHGQYVEEVKAAGGDVEAASKSDCGKPDHAVTPAGTGDPAEGGTTDGTGNGKGKGGEKGNGNGKGKGKGQDKHAGDPCKGRPPWAGDKTLTDEEKDALEAQRDAACPDDEDEDETEGPDDADGQGEDTDDPDEPDEAPEAPQAPAEPQATTTTVGPPPETSTTPAPAPDAATTTMVATPSSLP